MTAPRATAHNLKCEVVQVYVMAAPAAGLAASSFALLDATDGLRLVIDLLDPGEALFAGPPECRRAARAASAAQ